jgi:hypothetical protein
MPRKFALIAVLVILAAAAGTSQAGNLEPPGPVGPTMKSLDRLPSTWHQELGSLRFQIVMNGVGVLDHETGLVWERTPATGIGDWYGVIAYCVTREVGGRYGWRVPAIHELMSLIDPANSNPALPAGHPFNLEPGAIFWTLTRNGTSSDRGWAVQIEPGTAFVPQLTTEYSYWCVRGGTGMETCGQ